jgi:hypothetical protein
MPEGRVVMWRNLDEPGAERAIVGQTPQGWYLSGTVLIALPEPTEVRYTIECDRAWRTRQVGVELASDGEGAKLRLSANAAGQWLRGGSEPLDLRDGVFDVDLGVSPITNTLPIRRLGLDVGQSASIAVAWVRFPSLEVVRSVQGYERIAPNVYRFTDDSFEADLVVDDFGLVVSYPTGWERVAG